MEGTLLDQIKKLMILLSGFGGSRIQDISFFAYLFIMAISLVTASFISYLYLNFSQVRATGSKIHRCFPLVGLSVTAIFICIQFSLPLSLGLLGALSIVRFRTPIKEPEEIGFIMLVIATSIACATFNVMFLIIIVTLAVSSLIVHRLIKRDLDAFNEGFLIIRLSNEEYTAKSHFLQTFLNDNLHKVRLDTTSQDNGHCTISCTFTSFKKNSPFELHRKLNELVGESNFNIYYNRHSI